MFLFLEDGDGVNILVEDVSKIIFLNGEATSFAKRGKIGVLIYEFL